MPLLPLLGGWFLKVFALYAVTRIFLAAGIGYLVITGFNTFKDDLIANIQANYGSVPAATFEIMTLAGVDEAITIIISAVGIRLILNGLNAAGTLTKFKVGT